MTIGVGLGSMVTGRAISRTGRTAIFPSLGLIFVVLGLVVVALWSRHMSRMELSRSEEHTSELQSLMRISYAVFCLKKKKNKKTQPQYKHDIKAHDIESYVRQ